MTTNIKIIYSNLTLPSYMPYKWKHLNQTILNIPVLQYWFDLSLTNNKDVARFSTAPGKTAAIDSDLLPPSGIQANKKWRSECILMGYVAINYYISYSG